jgi:hypothetical protein
MRTSRTGRSFRAVRLLRPFAAILLTTALLPSAAYALSVTAPANVLGSLTVTASLTSEDTSGVARLVIDGVALRSAEVTQVPATITFDACSLGPGLHDVSVTLRGSDLITVSPGAVVRSWRKPIPPVLVSPSNGYCGKTASIVVKAGPDTTRLELWVNGHAYGGKNVVAGQIVGFGSVPMVLGKNAVRIVASNPVSSVPGDFSIRRLDFPWATCLVIDKSEFRLYWVRDGALVKTYPVAIGKPSTPTPTRVWKVGIKYVYGSWGVYGPRRLRLFKKVGTDSYQYTNYGVHGTNEEWVIGTMASHGCIRMYNKDVIELYPQVPLGTMVLTRD